MVYHISHQCCVSPIHKEADADPLSDRLKTDVKQSDLLKSSVLTSESRLPGMLQLHGRTKRTRHSDVPDAPQLLLERHSAEQQQLFRRRYHGIAAATSPAVSACSDVHNMQTLASADAPKASASSGKDSSLRGSSSVSSLGSDNPASGTSGSVTSATSNSAVSSTSAESDSSAADDASSTSVTSDNNALMVALSASDSSPSPPPAKRNRLADGQPDKAAPANYSWAADALAAITQAGPAGQAPAAKHASPIRQRGWFAAQHVSLLAAPALQASAHDVSARPNSSLKNRSRSSGTAQASSARQSRSPAAHTRSPVGKGRSSARLQSPGTYSRRSQRLSRSSKRRSKSRKGFHDRQRKSPARRHRSPERQRRSSSRSPVGVLWQHKVWQERVRAQLQSPDMAAGEQRYGGLHLALQAQRHARAGGSLHLAAAMGLTGASAHACVVSIQIVRSQLMYVGA